MTVKLIVREMMMRSMVTTMEMVMLMKMIAMKVIFQKACI